MDWRRAVTHLIGFALAYGAIACFFTATLALNMLAFSGIPLIPIVAVGISTIVVVAAWSVFGPGGYLRRVVLSNLLGLIVAAGVAIGSFLATITLLDELGMELQWFFGIIWMMFLMIPLISMAAQLPFWFFRMFWGWQFVLGDAEPARSYTLRDVFTITFLFALGFAAPQMAMNYSTSYSPAIESAGESQLVTQPDGTEAYEWVEFTEPEQIEQHQRMQADAVRQSIGYSFALAAVYAFMITVVCFPIVLFVFRPKDITAGFGLTVLYLLAWLILFGVLVLVTSGGGSGIVVEVFMWAAISIGAVGSALFIPFAVSRSVGIRLTSPARYKREQVAVDGSKGIPLVSDTGETALGDSQ